MSEPLEARVFIGTPEGVVPLCEYLSANAARVRDLEAEIERLRALADGYCAEVDKSHEELSVARKEAVLRGVIATAASKARAALDAALVPSTLSLADGVGLLQARLDVIRSLPRGWRMNADHLTVRGLADSLEGWFKDGCPLPADPCSKDRG